MGQNKFLRFSTVGVQMAVLIYLGAELGKYLDAKYTSESNLFTAICVLFSVGLSMYQLIRALPKDE